MPGSIISLLLLKPSKSLRTGNGPRINFSITMHLKFGLNLKRNETVKISKILIYWVKVRKQLVANIRKRLMYGH